MVSATLIRWARERSGLSLRHLAERAGTSHATIAAYEAGRVKPSVPTFERIVRAAGFGLVVELVPLVGDSVKSRGDELVQVLELAAQFPARHSPNLCAPRFGPR
jgi:transcriptional regulator with XRE-family HTH domain